MPEVKNKVSVIVPCFNQERFIGETLKSVSQQSFTNWECIVIDDGSTDQSLNIIQSFGKTDKRFHILSKTNGGVAEARNTGFARATGEFCVPLDGDDKLHPEFLKRAVECFVEEPEIDLVYCKTKRFGATRKIWRLPSYSYDLLLLRNMVVNTSMFRREAFFRAGGYATEMLHGYEDWDFYMRLLGPSSKVRFIDEPMFFYRVGQQSRSTELDASGRTAEYERLLFARNREKYAALLENPIGTIDRVIKEYSPTYKERYRRQLMRAHAGYGTALAAALLVIAGLLTHVQL